MQSPWPPPVSKTSFSTNDLVSLRRRATAPLTIGGFEAIGFHEPAVTKIKNYLETGRIDYKEISLLELAHLSYLADALGVRKVIADIQFSIDAYKPKNQDDLVRIINGTAECSSLNIDSLLEKIDLLELIKNDKLADISNADAVAQLFQIQLWLDEEVNRQWDSRFVFEKRLMTNVLFWIGQNQPTLAGLQTVLHSVPLREVFLKSNKIELAYDSFICEAMINSEKNYALWNDWMESKTKEVNVMEPENHSPVEERMAGYFSLPDSLYENARFGWPSAPQRAIPQPFPMAPGGRVLRSPTQDSLAVAVVRDEPVRLRKRDMLKNIVKIPYLKLKAKFGRLNR